MVREVETPAGTARVTWTGVGAPARAALFLGHGAGGGIDAPDLVEIARELGAAGVHVALVEQPYRVAGKKLASDKAKLDAAFVAVVEAERPKDLPVFVGGRSAGARVACRTASALGARGVVALAFPLVPPKGASPSRRPELVATGAPTLVVQGTRDPFGGPSDLTSGAALPPSIRISPVDAADHSFRVLRASGRPQRVVYAEVAATVRDFVLGVVD